jgi:hypothetical protein
LTPLGHKVVIFYTKLYQRVFQPGLAALAPQQPFPSQLAQALATIDQLLQSAIDQAFRVPVIDMA